MNVARTVRTLTVTLAMVIACIGAVAPQSKPIVVVYPFDVRGETVTGAASRIALVLGHYLGAGDQVEIKPATTGISRSGYLDDAHSLGADYYVSGSATAIGPDVAVLIHVVSARSGVAIWSETVNARTYADIANESGNIRDVIIADASHVGARGAQTPSPHSASSPEADEKSDSERAELFQRIFGVPSSPSP